MSDVKYTQGKIADFGYEDFKGKDTFYLVLQNEQGQNLPPVRGKGLEEAFKQVDNLQKGDSVNLKDMGIDEVTKKRMWEVERHEPYQNLDNAIERDVERDLQKVQTVDKTNENDEKTFLRPKERAVELGESLPDSIKFNYVGIPKNRFMRDEKVNYYDKSDTEQVNIAFEDRKNGLHTSRQDEKTVKAMMDLAESKGWTAIKLKGTEEFKQKAWLEASLRGIETKGYEPTEKDKAELIAKQEARTVNQVEATAVKEPAPKEIPEPVAQQPIAPKEPVSHEQASQMVYDELLKNGWEMKAVDGKVGEYPSRTMTDEQGETHQIYISAHDYSMNMHTPYLGQNQPTVVDHEQLHINYTQDEAKQLAGRWEEEYQKFTAEYGEKSQEEQLIKPKEIMAEMAVTTATPAPLQPVVGAGFLAKDVTEVTEYANEKVQDVAKDIKAQIRKITQDGYRDGSIANRNDLVKTLIERGFEVVKENEKSIRLSIPNSDQHLTLKGEMFTKDFDAIKQLKKSLEPEAIKERYPHISDVGIAQITAWKDHIMGKYTTPQAQQEILHRLDSSVKDVANGKDLGMPPIPVNEIKPEIDVQINTGDKSRSR